MSSQILVVDDEAGIRGFLEQALERAGYEVSTAGDGSDALDQLERRSFHLMITDLKMPRIDGLALLERAREIAPEMEVIVLTAHATVETAVSAMKAGALDYLTKPLDSPEELRLVVRRALEHRALRERANSVEESWDGEMIAVDPAMREVVSQIDRVAPTPATVLLLGESGTGKELAARRIHRSSPRAGGPFVAVNCAAVSPALIESEIFGHEKGAFTGATQRRRGRFERADGGVLFLDEVAELAAELQAKLLRVLQERRFERLGGSREIRVDVRLIAATNRDLEHEISAGRFRADLYHRLAVFPLRLPPLRERPLDIEPLARHLLARTSRALGRGTLSLSPAALERLRGHDWPGNVRELGNVLERAAIICRSEEIPAEDLALGSPVAEDRRAPVGPARTLREIEIEAIRQALASTGGHRRRAAEQLGIGLRTLYEKIKAYHL